MALQPAASLPASGGRPQPSPYVYSIPSNVLGKFCELMDCLNDYEWMRFASNVITDQIELRKIKCMEKTGISITRELMWWWAVRHATIQQLLELLNELQFYRAAKIIADWMTYSLSTDSVRTPLECPHQENVSLYPHGNRHNNIKNETEIAVPSNSAHSDPVLKADSGSLPSTIPPASIDFPHSLQSNPPIPSSVKPCSSSIPQQESLHSLPSRSLVWTKDEVEAATNGFSEENRMNESIFADSFKGRRHNTLYVVKRLKEKECANQHQTQRFFHTEVQICFRCCHCNILRLLGFTIESRCLIYPYMPNGSLTDRLQCQGGSEPLTWEKRISISTGLVQAIQYLHNFGILHGNVKSSNVLLDANFVPKLGHSGHRLQPMEKNTENGGIKTTVMQAFFAYFPEDFIRHGQLTKKVDIFSCGIVLAEILTGIKAKDERRHPIFLKDALLDEIQVAKELCCSKIGTFENLAAKEICSKYQDKNALHWPETSAICLATAACACLRKKNPDMAEVNTLLMKIADHQIQCQNMSEGRDYLKHSLNTPEETNDEPASPFNNCSSDDNCDRSLNAESLNCIDLIPPLIRIMPSETYSEQMVQVPCESDESSNFSWDPMRDAEYQQPNNGLQENVFPRPFHMNDPEYNNDITAKPVVSERHMPPQKAAFSSTRTLLNTEDFGATCSSQASAKETVREIKINDRKKKMMQDISLYKEKKLNTSELLNLN